ncbi:MAG: cupin domain-containing protein [Planctomycetes bacterium]|nr:cupin domain-containing protein [Planctomycetota bacterium]
MTGKAKASHPKWKADPGPTTDSPYRRGRFSARQTARGERETVEILAGLADEARVERIISQGQASPPDFWYDQTEDEWVMLTAGTATVAFEDRQESLRAGDWLFIPTHCRHRVASASEDAVWLAVFLPKHDYPHSVIPPQSLPP